jgi:hypothetical protein
VDPLALQDRLVPLLQYLAPQDQVDLREQPVQYLAPPVLVAQVEPNIRGKGHGVVVRHIQLMIVWKETDRDMFLYKREQIKTRKHKPLIGVFGQQKALQVPLGPVEQTLLYLDLADQVVPVVPTLLLVDLLAHLDLQVPTVQ